MALKVGTNFEYEGHNFLDSRQGMARTKADLKNWSVLVPAGFEVILSGTGEAYVYTPGRQDPEVGDWTKRSDYDLSGSALEEDLQAKSADILELMQTVFPLSFASFSGGGSYEYGQKPTPRISWTISRKGGIIAPDLVLVNNSTSGVAADMLSYSADAPIEVNGTYIVTAHAQGINVSKTASYNFYYKKYWGVSAKETLDRNDILGFSSTWATSWTMGATTFNCSGGKYPYYVLPSEYYSAGSFKVWIGGLRNTDLDVSDFTLLNASGVEHAYKVIRLRTKQTGSLSIKFADS